MTMAGWLAIEFFALWVIVSCTALRLALTISRILARVTEDEP